MRPSSPTSCFPRPTPGPAASPATWTGATVCAMYCGLDHGASSNPVRNLILLTMPIDGRESTYAKWVGLEDFDHEAVAEAWRVLPGRAVDQANKLLKPVTNFWTTYRRLWQQVQ